MQPALLLLLILLVFSTNAQIPVYQANGVAVNGYDPVAYFLENKPVAGKEAYSWEWNGVKWYFTSQENREKFRQQPEAYAPQYGGHCAYGASRGYLAQTDPQAFTIINGKLYLNYNLEVRTEWMKEVDDRISKADINWETKLKFKTK
jgi:YHS domain-containing protein